MPDTSAVAELQSALEAAGVPLSGDAQPIEAPATAPTVDEPTQEELFDQALSKITQQGTTAPPKEPVKAEPAATVPAEPKAEPSATPPILAYLKDRYGEDFAQKYKDDEQAIQGLLHA